MVPLSNLRNDIGSRSQPRGRDLPVAKSEDLEQREGFLCLLIAVDILNDDLGFAVLGDDQRFLPVRKLAYDLGSMGFEVADWLDSAGKFQGLLPRWV